jgi:sialic acid synthase SpsE
VAIKDILPGEPLTHENIWVKRPGTGELKAEEFQKILGKKVTRKIAVNSQLNWDDISSE